MQELDNLNILVTRPRGLEALLMKLLTEAGATPHHLPVIDITAPTSDASREVARDHLDEFDIAIFISPTAVQRTLAYMSIDDNRCRLCAIGSRSAAALADAGLHVAIQPDGHDSESLLAQDEMQREHVEGKRIVIFRGEDGRDVLAQELERRGARVHYAAMYNRVRPNAAVPQDLLEQIDAVTVSSNEGLRNLFDMVADAGADLERLLSLPLIVPGARAEQLAATLGFSSVHKASNATDRAVFDALVQAFSQRV